jgi:hypothetical protein
MGFIKLFLSQWSSSSNTQRFYLTFKSKNFIHIFLIVLVMYAGNCAYHFIGAL